MATKIMVTRKSDDVVTNIVDTAMVVENGLKVTDSSGEYIIGFYEECNKYDNVDIPDDVIPQKYKYTATEGFTANPNYKPYISIEEQVSNLGQQIANLKLQVIQLQGGTN